MAKEDKDKGMIKVVIVGPDHPADKAREVIEQCKALGCEVLLLDDKPFPQSTIEALDMSNTMLHRNPKDFFPKQGSKFHK